MEKNVLKFTSKAPYYKTCTISDHTKTVWIIFHGYGQLAEDFADVFHALESADTCLIFPQGLSKFYLKGVENKIGASWMTSFERSLDISNYLAYLNAVYESEVKAVGKQVKLKILGFSQGGHTASRWIAQAGIPYEHLILWGSSLAYEINKRQVADFFSEGQNTVVIGDKDRFIDQENLQRIIKRYEKISFDFELINYQGMHEIYPEILLQLI